MYCMVLHWKRLFVGGKVFYFDCGFIIVYSLEHKAMCQIRIRLDNVCNLVNTMYANVDCF